MERALMNIILEYSARKNKANGPPAYSTLNPETSSDSPSARSNGVRLVSARVEMYQMVAMGRHVRRNQECVWDSSMEERLKLPTRTTMQRMARPRLTS